MWSVRVVIVLPGWQLLISVNVVGIGEQPVEILTVEQAAPLNLEFQRANRVIPFPFHFLSNIQMNIKPRNYSWLEFYDRLIDVTKYSFSPRLALRRFVATGEKIPRWLNVVRAFSSERFARVQCYSETRRRLRSDHAFRQFFEQETADIPQFFVEKIRKDLGEFWDWLPESALQHNPNAYLLSNEEARPTCGTPRACIA
jgi:hypothetical protein